LGALAVFMISLAMGWEGRVAQTITFTTMAFGQLAHIFNVREKESFGLDRNILKNQFLILALIISVFLQLLAIYVPLLSNALGTTALNATQWLFVLAGAVLPLLIIQTERAIKRRIQKS